MRFGVLGAIGAAWLIGAALFLSADGSLSWTLARQVEPPPGEHNLAFYKFGPTLRASSYYRDSYSQHHPIFLVDGREQPHEIEKWVSGFHDRSPWVEIRWREPRTLARVVILHAGWRESEAYTVRRYTVSCVSDAVDPPPKLTVTHNEAPVATHALECARARGLRIEWTPNEFGDTTRVYEIEAWGQ